MDIYISGKSDSKTYEIIEPQSVSRVSGRGGGEVGSCLSLSICRGECRSY